MSIENIIYLLNKQAITQQKGTLTFNLANIEFPVTSKDIIGGILQEWFENWLIREKIPFRKHSNSQSWPDFYLENDTHLEIKAFNFEASPGFDIASFDAYTRSLLEHPHRLDSDHLIFGYHATDNAIAIKEFWAKKVWEMTGSSTKNFLALQVKQGIPVNIRPKDWRTNSDIFACRKDFVIALDKAIQHFHPNKYPNWLAEVSHAYEQHTENSL